MAVPEGRTQASSVYIDPPRWEDVRVPLSNTVGAGVHDPTLSLFRDNGAGSTGVFAWSFSNVQEQELFFTAQLPHYYKQGSDLHPHVHWSPSDAGAGNAVWGLEYTIQNHFAAPFPLTTLLTVAQAAGGIAFAHQVAVLPVIAGSALTISALIVGRLFRSLAGNTYASPAFGHEIDFHFQIDNIGSNLQFSKTD